MAASKFLVVALFAAVAVTTCRAADRINIDRKTLKHMTHAVGVDGFLEVNERATTQKGFQAEPVDIESGEVSQRMSVYPSDLKLSVMSVISWCAGFLGCV